VSSTVAMPVQRRKGIGEPERRAAAFRVSLLMASEGISRNRACQLVGAELKLSSRAVRGYCEVLDHTDPSTAGTDAASPGGGAAPAVTGNQQPVPQPSRPSRLAPTVTGLSSRATAALPAGNRHPMGEESTRETWANTGPPGHYQ
jgi:hypothetical protein